MRSDGVYSRRLLGDVRPVDLERALWMLVVVSLVGDVATTVVGLRLGLAESNPVARGAIAGYGVFGIVALKGVAVGIGLVCRPVLPRTYRSIVPAGLALPWTVAFLANLYTISTVT
ncbi:hypothetical protein ACFQGT_12355 [Natrialbaceae archaeon GCM10025810]|uniref:hypothetical protein n=1 Tax=Halovalidus salilacus TaxID=3075124 RepID=UPI003620B1C4